MSAIAAFNRLSGQQRIAGELVRSRADAAIDVLDPATEERIGEITDATPLRSIRRWQPPMPLSAPGAA